MMLTHCPFFRDDPGCEVVCVMSGMKRWRRSRSL